MHTQRQKVDRNYDFFVRHLRQYLADHRGQYALLKNADLVDFFHKPDEAYREGLRHFPDAIFFNSGGD